MGTIEGTATHGGGSNYSSATVDLPIEPRRRETPEEHRARMEAKSARQRRFTTGEKAASAATYEASVEPHPDDDATPPPPDLNVADDRATRVAPLQAARLLDIPVDELHPHPDNVRKDLGDLTELTASIRARGLLQPLVVTPTRKGWLVVDGHRRLAAGKRAGKRTLPALAGDAADLDEQLSTMLAAALHKGLEPMEQARAFVRLRDRGHSVADIARATGLSVATVSGRLVLTTLPAEVQQMVTDGRMTATAAVELGRDVRAGKSGSARRAEPKSAWFTPQHALAPQVAGCEHTDTRRAIGGACGQCWEKAIRDDERHRVQTEGARA